MGAYSVTDPHIIESKNPVTGEVLGTAPVMDAAAVKEAVARARAAQASWGALPVRDRAARLSALRDQIVRRASEICERISQECGKPRSEALSTEVAVVADCATYFIKRAHK